MTTESDLMEQARLATGFNPDSPEVFGSDVFSFYIPVAKEVAPWWSRVRDAELRSFWKDGQQGAAIMYRAQSKLAAIPLRVEARDKSITAHVRQAQLIEARLLGSSGMGSGLHEVLLKFCEDYLAQDNGAFAEILGEGDATGPIEGPVIGLRHLDASRCTRTGHPIYPVVYTGDDNVQYKMHAARILFMSQMPSALKRMNGVGMCSVSRSLRILENLHHVVNYKDEKMGARATSQILVGTGITGKEIIKAMAASEAMMDNLGLQNMIRTTALGSAGGEVDLKRVELNTLDPFDEQSTYTFAAYALALAWGLEFNEIIPIQGNKASDIASLQRSRAMLPQTYKTGMEQQCNIKLVPAHLKVYFDFYDDQRDQQRASIEDTVSRSYSRQIDSGYTTPLVVQEKLHEQGYVNNSQLRSMKLDNGLLFDNSPVQTLFFDDRYAEFFRLPPEMLASLSWGDPETALALIEANEVYVYQLMGSRRSSVYRNQALDSLAALDWLKDQYARLMFRSTDEEEETVDEEAEEEEREEEDSTGDTQRDGRLRNQDTGQ